jgi:hypothetical protein
MTSFFTVYPTLTFNRRVLCAPTTANHTRLSPHPQPPTPFSFSPLHSTQQQCDVFLSKLKVTHTSSHRWQNDIESD